MDNRQTDAGGGSAIRRPCHEPCLLPFCSVLASSSGERARRACCGQGGGRGGTGRRFVNCGCWAVAGDGLTCWGRKASGDSGDTQVWQLHPWKPQARRPGCSTELCPCLFPPCGTSWPPPYVPVHTEYVSECPAVRGMTSSSPMCRPRQPPPRDVGDLCNVRVVARDVWAGAHQPLTCGLVSLADVDECELGTHSCQAGAVCHNTKGSFYCQARQRCLEGFLQDPEGNCVGERGLPAVSAGCGRGWGWSSGGVVGGMGSEGFRDRGGLGGPSLPSLRAPCECQCLGPRGLCRRKLL